MELLKRLFGGRQRSTAEKVAPELDPYENEVDPFDPFPDPVEIAISDVIDLHSFSPRDVKLLVEEYLIQAHTAGYRTVRLIHGKGIGVQREMVRTILARTPFVIDFSDAPPDAGGWGATIAHLDDEH